MRIQKITQNNKRHELPRALQTGFPSAATHYTETPIDINQELVYNPEATFYLRVEGNAYTHLHIFDNDVLIVDRALKPQSKSLLVITHQGNFGIQAYTQVPPESILWGVITYVIHDVR